MDYFYVVVVVVFVNVVVLVVAFVVVFVVAFVDFVAICPGEKHERVEPLDLFDS